MKLKILTTVAALICVLAPAAYANNDWIVGGAAITTGNELPNIVSLREANNFEFCGGTLIAPDWVLTAGHCITKTKFRVVVGGLKISANDGQSFDVDRTYVNPLFKGEGSGNDFALIHLKGSSKVAPMPLDPTVINQNAKYEFFVAGWGATSEMAGQMGRGSDILLKVNVDFIPTALCNQAYPGHLDNTMLCAGDMENGGRDSCQGDSGGPLYELGPNNQPVLVGVVSWGEGCARPKFPGVYGAITAAMPWIQTIIPGFPNTTKLIARRP